MLPDCRLPSWALTLAHPAGRRVKSYEGKLATLTAINSALQTENDKLRKEVEAKPTTATDQEVEGERKAAWSKAAGWGCHMQRSVGEW